uniref:Nascent polypeptide-associated complex subunit alpha, muscle-specific form-like isoform X3 n=1 Tax=Petromyzon marinus TaxID=7757 RepID=A0AAJ7U9I1_PETMA|nr:nascent polypeptide-associated complex subunit alpha, muscle-specific form-like isoform X3 [Petromyzon marinus]
MSGAVPLVRIACGGCSSSSSSGSTGSSETRVPSVGLPARVHGEEPRRRDTVLLSAREPAASAMGAVRAMAALWIVVGASVGATVPGHAEGPALVGPGHVEGPTLVGPGHSEGPALVGPGHAEGPTLVGPGHSEGPALVGPGHAEGPTLVGPGHAEGPALVGPGHAEVPTLVGPGHAEGPALVGPGHVDTVRLPCLSGRVHRGLRANISWERDGALVTGGQQTQWQGSFGGRAAPTQLSVTLALGALSAARHAGRSTACVGRQEGGEEGGEAAAVARSQAATLTVTDVDGGAATVSTAAAPAAVSTATATPVSTAGPSMGWRFERHPQDATVPLGSPLALRCRPPQSRPPALVDWFRDGAPLDTDGGGGGGGGGELLIPSVTESDAGVYFCRAVNALAQRSVASRRARVRVLVPPSFPSATPHGTVRVAVGRGVTLGCPALGRPPPALRWSHEGSPVGRGPRWALGARNASLHVSNVEASDRGRYACHASNAAGEATLVFHLHVGVPPVVVVFLESVAVDAGSAATLPCVAAGDAPLRYSWSRDGAPVPPGDARVRRDRGGASLELRAVSARHAGVYVCTVLGPAGSASHRASLRVRERPRRSWEDDDGGGEATTATTTAPSRLITAAGTTSPRAPPATTKMRTTATVGMLRLLSPPPPPPSTTTTAAAPVIKSPIAPPPPPVVSMVSSSPPPPQAQPEQPTAGLSPPAEVATKLSSLLLALSAPPPPPPPPPSRLTPAATSTGRPTSPTSSLSRPSATSPPITSLSAPTPPPLPAAAAPALTSQASTAAPPPPRPTSPPAPPGPSTPADPDHRELRPRPTPSAVTSPSALLATRGAAAVTGPTVPAPPRRLSPPEEPDDRRPPPVPSSTPPPPPPPPPPPQPSSSSSSPSSSSSSSSSPSSPPRTTSPVTGRGAAAADAAGLRTGGEAERRPSPAAAVGGWRLLEPHDVPVVVGSSVSLLLIFLVMGFYSVRQRWRERKCAATRPTSRGALAPSAGTDNRGFDSSEAVEEATEHSCLEPQAVGAWTHRQRDARYLGQESDRDRTPQGSPELPRSNL